MMHRLITLVAAALMLAACTNPNDLDEAPAYLGNFSLGHNVTVTPNITKGPASRDASDEEWITAMQLAVDERFSRYDGDKLYHLGISIEGYVLAIPGVPIVASPKSALIIRVTAWDDAAGKKLNEEPNQITIVESFSGNTMLGSGLTQSKEVQMKNLTRNASKQIQNWLVQENSRNGWFEDGSVPSKAAKEAVKTLSAPDGDAGAAEAGLTPAQKAAAVSTVIVEPDVAAAE